jgi:hypothetical protein
METQRSPLQRLSTNETWESGPSQSKRPRAQNKGNDRSSMSSSAHEPTATFVYPEDVAIPSRGVVKALYEEAISSKESNQHALSDAGLLSFEDVLLPAVAYQEEHALKALQARVQRDNPDAKPAIVACRKVMFDSIGAAVEAAKESRIARDQIDREREAVWQAEQEVKRVTAAAEQDRLAKVDRERHRRDLKKKLPRNQELWREVAYLMTELNKLHHEARQWKDTEEDISQREIEMKALEEKKKSDSDEEPADTEIEISTDKITKIEQTVEDITLSAVRIEQALHVVSGIIIESDKVRKDLYRRYKTDFQFHRYPGVKNPKGILRALTQSQDQDEE